MRRASRGRTGAFLRCPLASDPLSPEETRRYARHLVLKGMGGRGQQALKAARVLVVGAGGLGSPVIAYLAGAGVGTLGIAEHDEIALSNLQRQVIHTSAGIGSGKAESARDFAAALNPHVAIRLHPQLTAANADAELAGYDIVLDGTDNLVTRRAVAAAAAKAGIPLVSGAVSMFDGQVTVFAPGGPGFDALYPIGADDADLPSCEATGILGPLTGVIGTLMAMEAIKLITSIGTPLIGRVLTYDSQGAHFSEFAF
ncbi:HesA/MoeB/ThiF family protein [Devosia aquimaris]|uniref:HesA/MoeB/ThiF family protein n=1 Tax=Devosia aquimaris TaxID=2866214 RepID=UPI0037BEC948